MLVCFFIPSSRLLAQHLFLQGIGGVSGFQGSDTLNLGGFVVPKQTIGTVLVESADYSGGKQQPFCLWHARCLRFNY